jgi:hypothetical protein
MEAIEARRTRPVPAKLDGNVMRAFRVVLRPGMNYRFSNGKAATARSEEVHGSQDEF